MDTQIRTALFDIDGTLARSSSVHLDVLRRCLRRATGIDPRLRIEGETPWLGDKVVAGYIDAQCVREAYAQAGMTADDATLARIMGEYVADYRAALRAGADAGELIPGVPDVLEQLSTAGVRMALVTGNASGIAQAKLEALGIARYFTFDPAGGFGDSAQDRSDAASRGAAALGAAPGSWTVLVGDTPADMRAALAQNCTPVGVATGSATPEQLREAGGLVVLDSLAQLPGALAHLGWFIDGAYAHWMDRGLHEGDSLWDLAAPADSPRLLAVRKARPGTPPRAAQH